MKCLNCQKPITEKYRSVYCSEKCKKSVYKGDSEPVAKEIKKVYNYKINNN